MNPDIFIFEVFVVLRGPPRDDAQGSAPALYSGITSGLVDLQDAGDLTQVSRIKTSTLPARLQPLSPGFFFLMKGRCGGLCCVSPLTLIGFLSDVSGKVH